MHNGMHNKMRKWVMWVPVLMVGALLYWTLALSFGGLSLLTFSALHDSDAFDSDGPSIRDSYQSITVNLAGQPDPQGDDATDVDPAAGSVTVDLVSDRESGPGGEHGQATRGQDTHQDQGPGKTAF
jgi:hypothetical protein